MKITARELKRILGETDGTNNEEKINDKVVVCTECRKIYECGRTYLGGCTDGKRWGDDDEGKMQGED